MNGDRQGREDRDGDGLPITNFADFSNIRTRGFPSYAAAHQRSVPMSVHRRIPFQHELLVLVHRVMLRCPLQGYQTSPLSSVHHTSNLLLQPHSQVRFVLLLSARARRCWYWHTMPRTRAQVLKAAADHLSVGCDAGKVMVRQRLPLQMQARLLREQWPRLKLVFDAWSLSEQHWA